MSLGVTIRNEKQKILGAYTHYSQRLKERFNISLSFDDYIKNEVLKISKKDRVNYPLLIKENVIIKVYAISRQYKFPITVYKVDGFNKNR